MNCGPCAGNTPLFFIYAIAGYNGHIYAGGNFLASYSSTPYGNFSSTGNPASYLEEYTGIVGINEMNNISRKISIFPNPSKGIFNIQLQGINEKTEIHIYNLLGENICNTQINTNTTKIDLTSQPPGTYLYRIVSEKGEAIGSGKLIISQ